MGSAEKYSFQSNEFQNNIQKTFRFLRKTEDYSDVTLVCEEGKHIKVHKVVLASSCIFFRDLLKKNSHSHPLIYMRGIKYHDLSGLIDFIYHGETEVGKDDLETFLEVGNELSVHGLTKQMDKNVKEYTIQTLQEDNASEDSKEIFDCDTCGKSYGSKGSLRNHKYEHENENKLNDIKDKSAGETIPKYELHRPQTTNNINDSMNSLDECFDDVDNYEKNIDEFLENREGVWNCLECGKNDKLKFLMRRHVEMHIVGFTFDCKKCKKTFPYRYTLKAHVLRVHSKEMTSKPYNCYICSSNHKNARSLKEHNNRIHKGSASYEKEAEEKSNF